jgi:2-iminobutanoate/2-iminopropanoate deaminase
MGISIVHTDKAPKPVGPYAQAVAAGGFLYTSGQIAIDPGNGEFKNGSIEEQTELVLQNLQAVLNAKGAEFKDVVAACIYLMDLRNFAKVNAIYARAMGTHTPARTTVQVTDLPLHAAVEISLVAFLDHALPEQE